MALADTIAIDKITGEQATLDGHKAATANQLTMTA
jgi:hypothetical protein